MMMYCGTAWVNQSDTPDIKQKQLLLDYGIQSMQDARYLLRRWMLFVWDQGDRSSTGGTPGTVAQLPHVGAPAHARPWLRQDGYKHASARTVAYTRSRDNNVSTNLYRKKERDTKLQNSRPAL